MKERLPPLQIAIAAAGNFLFWYCCSTGDWFVIYSSAAHFPVQYPQLLRISEITWLVSLFIGAATFGWVGDRLGRKPAMIFPFVPLAAGLMGLALTPSYADIGMASPILIIILHVLLGFAAGGGFGPIITYLFEAAPEGRRGLVTSLQAVSSELAILFAPLIPLAGQATLLGLCITIVCFVLLAWSTLGESRVLQETVDRAAAPLHVSQRRIVVLGFFIILAGAMFDTIENYTILNARTGLRPGLAPWALMACCVLVALIAGWLSDRFGRKPVMIVPSALLIVLLVGPLLFHLWPPDRTGFLAAAAVVLFLGVALRPAVTTALAEALPAPVRVRGIAVIGVSVVATIHLVVGSPGRMLTNGDVMDHLLICCIGLGAMFAFPETAPIRFRNRAVDNRT